MKFDEFVAEVRKRVEFDNPDRPAEATAATLEVLGQRLAGGEPSDLAAQLPDELAGYLSVQDGDAGSFDVDEFYRRVADRIATTPAQAREWATGVMSTLADLVTEGEVEDLAAQLPSGYAELLR